MDFYFLSLLILCCGALLATIVKETLKFKACIMALFAAATAVLIPAFKVLLTGETLSSVVVFPYFIGNVNFIIDPLSAFFIIVISVMSFTGILYADGYIKDYLQKGMNVSSHCFFIMMLTASMIVVVTVQNIIFFLIVWEIMSLSSFFLVIFEGHKQEVVAAGIKYLVYMHISVLFIIAAFAFAANISGGVNFSDFTNILRENSAAENIFFILAFIGFGTKAGFVPFHNWLPDAHPAAPSHVSGIMSGVMIKTGIYGILRVLLIIGTPSKFIAYIVLFTAVISAIYGVIYAIAQHDIKRLLAYHSIENIGIIGIGTGVGMLGLAYGNNTVAAIGFAGGILHILNHSIFKELLFFAAGNTYLKTHSRDIESLGGLNKAMPFTTAMFITGSIAICGLPPFNGFISEFLIYAGMIKAVPGSNIQLFLTMVFSTAMLALIGTMAILCFTKASGVMFLGTPRSDNAAKVKNDISVVMIIPMTILALFSLLIGIFPQYILKFVLMPVSLFVTGTISETINEMSIIMSIISLCCFTLILIVTFLLTVKYLGVKKTKIYTTWGCGYNKPNCRMQYTATSYADLLISTLKPLFKRISHIKKPHDLFPKEAYYDQHIEDIEEAYIVKPIIKLDEKILSKFERIQNGNIQLYIAFGLIFLLIAIAGMCIGVN